MTPTPPLQTYADAARSAGERWAAALTGADQAHLGAAFHRAESLAHAAIEQALDQVAEAYRPELLEQLRDEERHVAVFAAWQATPCEPIQPARSKPRRDQVWFTTLLLNELAGYCQFHMLAGLVGDAVREADVLAVARDEEVHIARLTGWLAPDRDTASWRTVEAMAARFTKKLPSRMTQFLPRDELGALRAEMAEITATLIGDIVR